MKINKNDLIKMQDKVKFIVNDEEICYITEKLNKIFENCEKLKNIEKQDIVINEIKIDDLREDYYINSTLNKELNSKNFKGDFYTIINNFN